MMTLVSSTDLLGNYDLLHCWISLLVVVNVFCIDTWATAVHVDWMKCASNKAVVWEEDCNNIPWFRERENLFAPISWHLCLKMTVFLIFVIFVMNVVYYLKNPSYKSQNNTGPAPSEIYVKSAKLLFISWILNHGFIIPDF